MQSVVVENAVKAYGAMRALDGVSLRIEPGELFFLLGPSGCGKTTLLRSIAGFVALDAGTIRIGKRDVTHARPQTRQTAMVFQSYALWPHMTLFDNVAFGLRQRRLGADEIRRRAGEALAAVHMADQMQKKPNQLSGGQQQRVALARALVVRPDCLLLDEPLSNLDAKLRVEMRDEIRRICKEHGLTGIYVTHDQKEALAIADRIAVMHAGRLAQVGTPQEVYTRPRDRFVADFLGRANFLAATVRVDGAAPGGVLFETRRGVFAAAEVPDFARTAGGRVMLAIRPESFRREAGGGAANGHNRIEAAPGAARLTHLGETRLWRLDALNGADAPLEILELSVGPPPREDAPAAWSVAPEAVMVLPEEA